MRRGNKKIVTIVIILVVLIAAVVAGAILYLKTDLFKSNQELFFKYLAQNMDVIDTYLQDPNKVGLDEIKSGTHVVNSNITFDLVSSNSEIANQTTPPRNFSISYTKNADPLNDRDYSEAKVKYLTKELFTAKYAHDGDYHVINGNNVITTKDLFNIYLGIENSNLKDFAKKLGVEDTSNVPNKLGNVSITGLLNLTQTEKEYIQNLLINVTNSQIAKDSYYHNKGVTIDIDANKVETNAYGISLTNEQYQNLVVAILNVVSNDETALNIILQKVMLVDLETDMTTDKIAAKIQEIIKQINVNGFEDGIKIQVHESEGKIVRTQIETNSNEYYIFDFERNENAIRTLISLNYTYTATDENEQQQINNNITFIDDGYQIIEGSASGTPQEIISNESTYTITGIELAKQISGTQNNIIGIITFNKNDEVIKISLQNKTEANNTKGGYTNNVALNINNSDITYFGIKANSNITPSDTISVQEINETNSAVLNNRTPENISGLLTAIKTQLETIYKQHMEVAKQVQEQENSGAGLTPVNPNAEEANTITNRDDVVQ